MRIPFLSLFMTSPFDGLLEHAEKVKECVEAFQQAVACHVTDKCTSFETNRQDVNKLESEADAIKRRIRGHIPKEAMLPVNKFELFMYLKEQDKVLDSVEDALNWLSYRLEPGVPEALKDDLFALVEAVIHPIEELSPMVSQAKQYFKSFSNEQREKVKAIINRLRQQEHQADKIEEKLKHKIFSLDVDAVSVYHMITLVEMIGAIADHAENAGDMMRAMIAK